MARKAFELLGKGNKPKSRATQYRVAIFLFILYSVYFQFEHCWQWMVNWTQSSSYAVGISHPCSSSLPPIFLSAWACAFRCEVLCFNISACHQSWFLVILALISHSVLPKSQNGSFLRSRFKIMLSGGLRSRGKMGVWGGRHFLPVLSGASVF